MRLFVFWRSWLLNLFQSVRRLKPADALHDAIAGLTLAAMNIPQALGYTKIAGMPVVTGLYTLLLPLIGFAAFGSSPLPGGGSRFGYCRYFCGRGVKPRDGRPADDRCTGGRHCVAYGRAPAVGTFAQARIYRRLSLTDGARGLSHGSRVSGRDRGARRDAWDPGLCSQADPATGPNLQETAGGTSADAGCFRRRGCNAAFVSTLRARGPGALIAVVGAISASAIWDFGGHGIEVIGPVAGGLPHLGIPAVSWKDLVSLISLAASCSIMIITQSAATARIYANRHRQELDENADLAGLSAANAMAGLSGTFIVNGSPTQTAMVEGAGAQSQVAQLSTAAVVALVLLFFTKPLAYLPHCVLGALVFMIAIRMIKLRSLADIRRESPGEFALAVTTASVVVVAGVEQGILLAMALSLLRIVRHSYHPHTGVMVKNEDGSWKLIPVAPGAMTKPGLVMYRFGATLFYANASRFAAEVNCLVGERPSPVRWVVVDAEAITAIDFSAARVVRELQQDLKSCGVELGFARAAWELKADFVRHGLTEVIDPSRMYGHLHDVLATFAKLQATTS